MHILPLHELQRVCAFIVIVEMQTAT